MLRTLACVPLYGISKLHIDMETVITETNFKSVVSSGKPVLVDFWAAWCAPCRMLSPTVDDIAGKYEGRLTVAKCNIDDCPGIADAMGIRAIPTLVYFKDGKVVGSTTGVVPQSDIEERLSNIL